MNKNFIIIFLATALVLEVVVFPSVSCFPQHFNTHGHGRHLDVLAPRSTAPCPSRPTPVPLPKPLPQQLQQAFANITTLLKSMLGANGVTGISAAVVYQQDIIWNTGLGYKDVKQPNVAPDLDTIYRIASVTKTFPALMLYQAYERGAIRSLDDEIRKYIPAFQIQNPFSKTESITWKQVASHLAGLPREAPCGVSCPTRTAQVLDLLKNNSLIVPTWTVPSYSNLGLALLGHFVAENIFSTTFEDYVQANYLKPLGMTNTGFTYTPAVKSKMAVGYNADGSVADLVDLGWESPAGQAHSSARDLVAWMKLFTLGTNTNILSPGIMKEFLLPVFANFDGDTMFGAPWEIRYQNNFLVRRKGGNIGGYSSLIAVVPELNVGLTVLWNGGADGLTTADYAFSSLLPALQNVLESIQPPKPSPPKPEAYYGNYTFQTSTATILPSTSTYGKYILLNIPNLFNVFLVWQQESTDPAKLQIYIPDGLLNCLAGDFLAYNYQSVYFTLNSNNVATGFSIPGLLPGVEFTK